MTSGNFSSAPISSIIVNRDERQRRKLEGIEELAESINRIGLINPIVVTPDLVLVAGERPGHGRARAGEVARQRPARQPAGVRAGLFVQGRPGDGAAGGATGLAVALMP